MAEFDPSKVRPEHRRFIPTPEEMAKIDESVREEDRRRNSPKLTIMDRIRAGLDRVFGGRRRP